MGGDARCVAALVFARGTVTNARPGRSAHRASATIACVDAGLYVALFLLPRPMRRRVGALGWCTFAPGLYAYIGSAQRNLAARLRRHARRSKPLRWHIDYLSTRATMLGALLFTGRKDQECRLADRLAGHWRRAIADFGASDCRCGGHLFFMPLPSESGASATRARASRR